MIYAISVKSPIIIPSIMISKPNLFAKNPSVFGLGFTMQIVNRIFKYEPRNTNHEDLIETTKRLLRFREDKKGEDF